MKIIVKDNYDEMSKYAADVVAELVKEKPEAVLGLATGSTPVGMYRELVKMYDNGELSFKDVKTVNLDEYVGLDGDHDQSYRHFMNDQFFNHVDINLDNTYVPNGMAENLNEESARYDELIDNLGGQDLQVLGIGENGHIGFNEPSSKLDANTHVADLVESTIEANSRFFDSIDDVPKTALSMGMGKIFQAKKIILLASGANKAKAMKSLQEDSIITPLIPATFLKLHPDVTIIMDKEANGE